MQTSVFDHFDLALVLSYHSMNISKTVSDTDSGTTVSIPPPKEVRILLVGDANIGKSSLIAAYTQVE